MATDTSVSNLVINKMTKAQYESLTNPSTTELYLVPDEMDTTPTSGSTNPVTSSGIYQAISVFESTSNKVTSISSGSTDVEYPSAKCVYDLVGDIETILASI